jgi:hypothetical protein
MLNLILKRENSKQRGRRMKKVYKLVLIVFCLLSATVVQAKNMNLVLDGKDIKGITAIEKKGSLMVPIKFLEHMGCTVKYDNRNDKYVINDKSNNETELKPN